MKLATLIALWRRFFFAPSSVIPIAVFRIFWALLVLQILLVSFGDNFLFWFRPDSIVPFEAVREYRWENVPRLDLILLFPKSDSGLWMFYFSMVTSATLTLLGLGGRIPVAYTALSVLSMHNHQPYIINGGDVLVRISGLFLALSPATDALSIDEWFRQRRTGIKFCPLAPPWAGRLIQIQLCIMYCASVSCKLAGQQWLNGTAVYYALQLDDLVRTPLPWISNSLVLCKILTWSTIVIEAAMFTLVWIKQLRYFVLLAAVALHLGIDAAINLPVFEWITMAMMITFVEMPDLYRFTHRTGG